MYAELTQLEKLTDLLLIIPATAKQKQHNYGQLPGSIINMGALSIPTIVAALIEWVKSPITVIHLFMDVVTKPRSMRTKVNNALIFPKALAVARLLRYRRITHVHAYWISTPSTIAYLSSRLSGVQWSATGHRWDLVDTNLTSEPVANAGFMARATFIRSISERGRRQVLLALAEWPKAQVKTIHLGVNIPKLKSKVLPQTRPFTLVCVAGMERVKGHVYLLQSLARALEQGVELRCDLIGDGSLRPALQKQASALKIAGKVDFLGRIPLEAVHERLHQGVYDAAILTSIDEGSSMCEGIPVSLMEAMSYGVPCIATDSGSINELVDGEVGMLLPQRDPENIAAGILALASDGRRRRALGKHAAKRIEQEFSAHRTAAALFALLKESESQKRGANE